MSEWESQVCVVSERPIRVANHYFNAQSAVLNSLPLPSKMPLDFQLLAHPAS